MGKRLEVTVGVRLVPQMQLVETAVLGKHVVVVAAMHDLQVWLPASPLMLLPLWLDTVDMPSQMAGMAERPLPHLYLVPILLLLGELVVLLLLSVDMAVLVASTVMGEMPMRLVASVVIPLQPVAIVMAVGQKVPTEPPPLGKEPMPMHEKGRDS